MGTLPVKGGKASKSGILTGFATITCALFAGLYGEPAMALADDVARACPAECWLNLSSSSATCSTACIS
ncbi:MAG: hypothetical protein ACLU1W_07165 [Collinsella sp.]